MDMEDFQEKMDPAHRADFCRMLKTKVLLDCLLEEYLKVKMILDRIDGFLSQGDLAMIAIIAGYDPTTGKFCVTEQTVEQSAKETMEKTAAPVEAPAVTGVATEAEVASGAAKPVGPSLDEPTDQVVEETLEQPETDEQKPDLPASASDRQTDEQPTAQPAASGKLWSPGMPVNVLHEDELKSGTIAGIHPPEPGSNKAVQLTIDLGDGNMLEVDEDEVEAD